MTNKPGRNRKLKKVKLLMAASYFLLLCFSVQWMITQYRQEEARLQQDLARMFDEVQQNITDSLLLVSLVNPAMQEMKNESTITGRSKDKEYLSLDEDSIRKLSSLLFQNETNDLSLQGLKVAVRKVKKLSPDERQVLFRVDTTVFNSEYVERMKQLGWNFPVRWVSSREARQEKEYIFIPNNYLHSGYGIIVTGYGSYLLSQLWMQGIFALVLLGAILLAFRTTYTSLSRQIQLSALKDDFVSNISHELKTPLATVKVAIEAVQHFEATGDHNLSSEYMQMAALELDRLELLVNRSLHTSLLESGQLSIQPEPNDLKTIIEEVLQAYQVKLLSYEATVRLEVTGDNFLAQVDKLHLQGVLINLLDNSLKYSAGHPEIRLLLQEQQNIISLSVIDNGPGIPEAYQTKVFDKFFRIPAGDGHVVKGYGLGLSYASQVMRQHKGRISVSNHPDGGCNFTLSLQQMANA